MEQTPKPAEAPKPRNRTVLYAIIVVVLIVVGVGVFFLTQTSSGYNVAIQDDNLCTPSNSDPACLFNPTSVNATVNGAAITWKNIGKVTHTVTSCDSTNGASTAQCPNGPNASGLDPSFTGNVATGGTYPHTFAHAGTYYYYCAIHPWMHGTVVAK